MSTIGNQLNILRDTQMVQRRRLEKMFPYIEWDRMPFSSYNDFFRLRGIIDDCGAVWTNAYGRSNGEADGQRNFLEDYSGNGRDIELFNFGFNQSSGWNGFVRYYYLSQQSGSDNQCESEVLSVGDARKIHFSKIFENIFTLNALVGYISKDSVGTSYDGKIRITGLDDLRKSYPNARLVCGDTTITNDGISSWSFTKENEDDLYLGCGIQGLGSTHPEIICDITIEQIPDLNGALVSDGVDDYGQCIKDFALPSDYTVVAMRELLNAGPSGIINKTRATGEGAFIFEYGGSQSYSYGDNYSGLTTPKLFSYQTKASYNGTVLTPGTGADTADDKLLIFRLRDGTSNYISAALYSFGIFTRTLTEEELRVVENCMYAEWIAMTGKLEDIEYYDILDARFRSNEEAEDKRNRWTGRLGKLHMTLNNYAYSQMSGWNGYAEDYTTYNHFNEIFINGNRIVATRESNRWMLFKDASRGITIKPTVVKIMGIKSPMLYYYVPEDNSSTRKIIYINRDGIYSLPASVVYTRSAPGLNGVGFYCGEYEDQSGLITIEQLPLYGGALVSDGVDDYAVSDETISEEIGGFVCYAEKYGEKSNAYAFDTNNNESRLYAYADTGNLISGTPDKSGQVSPFFVLSRNPASPAGKLLIGSNNTNIEFGDFALYQLRLIKTQPTDTQLEAIKWQCRKEHEDYLVHMGWKDETPGWYGVEWDMTDPSPDLKRIGNMQMHRDLPVHVQMRGCLLNDDGVVQKYLDPDDWTSETLDGSAGQVMVQAPIDSYWRFEKDGNICRAKFSPTALPGFKRTPQGFLGSEEATVQRSTNKLCSVVNEDADYRGGNNNSAWDGTYRSLLGMPATAISRTNFRTYARNRKSGSTEWNMNEYDLHKLLYWLAVVQYATFSLQKPVNTEKDADGFSQGGLGSGVTTLNYNKWVNFNSVYPFIPCGLTASLGNGSGQVAFTMPFEYDAAPSSATGLEVPYMGEYSAAAAYTNGQFVSQGEELYECTADASAGTALTDTAHFTKVTRTVVYANRYLGVALPFGHIWKMSDGVNFRISADTSAGGDGRSQMFTCSDPAKFSDQGYDGYRYIGDAPRANGYVKEIVFGEDGDIVPISTGGSTTTYFCDYWYTAIPASGESLRGVLFGGHANNGATAGLAFASSNGTPSTSYAYFGSRLCFIPA